MNCRLRDFSREFEVRRDPGYHSGPAGGINNRLRSIKAVLNKLRKLGRLPHITGDAIKDGIELEAAEHPRPLFLQASQIQALLQAALRHDAKTFDMTREEKDAGLKGTTPRHDPIAPFVVFMLLTGCRAEEALSLTWSAVDLDARGVDGKKVGTIQLAPGVVKTGHAREIDLGVCPGLRKILDLLLKADAKGPYVFGGEDPWTRTKIDDARERLIDVHGAPPFTWSQRAALSLGRDKPPLRATCGTSLTNAPGIYGAASAVHASKRLGHSIAIAEKRDLGLVRGIPKGARTLEAAMGIVKALAAITARLRDRTAGASVAGAHRSSRSRLATHDREATRRRPASVGGLPRGPRASARPRR